MTSRAPVIGLLLLVLLAGAPSLHAAIPVSERDALIAIYNKTGGPNWANKSGWLGAPGTECSWFGVFCNQSPNFVAILDLRANNVTGPLPVELAQLTKLEELYLQGNALNGTIPKALANLPLRTLNLGQNQITGAIPTELGSTSTLRSLVLDMNDLTGGIPSALGQLSLLITLHVHTNPRLGGTLPPELAALKNLEDLTVFDSGINGTIPPAYGGMTSLRRLRVGGNNLTGTLPEELGNLANLEWLIVRQNNLTGEIPSWLVRLTNLTVLNLYENRFTGPIPPEIGNLTKLESLLLGGNALTGTMPPELGKLTAMREFRIWNTEIGGPFPAFLAGFPALQFLYIDGNRLSGPIPSVLGTLTRLEELSLANNAFTGEIPSALGNLVNLLDDAGLDLQYNGLTSSDAALVAFLESKQIGKESFTTLQTVPPTGVSATAISPTSIRVDWTPIAYQANAGGYQIEVATSPNGPFGVATTTPNKAASSAQVSGLPPSTTHYFRLSTVTYGGGVQKNTIVSATTQLVSATTLASAASVVMTVAPQPLTVQADGVATATTGYTLSNVGQRDTTVTLAQNGTFFTQSPSSFTLAAGASQRVTITSLPQGIAIGVRGSSIPSGAGVPSNLVVPVSCSRRRHRRPATRSSSCRPRASTSLPPRTRTLREA
ncbi:MAG: fibronectin type III domain-containing protein [Thermoanaerobaculia bacterium]|jgi:Leucine-rich repeat (LRR) protein